MEKANKNKQLKVLLVNGSPHRSGNTFTALSEVAKTLEEKDIKTEIVHIGNRPVQGCIACYKCREKSFCVFQDEIYLTLREKLAKANGIIIGSPVYFGALFRKSLQQRQRYLICWRRTKTCFNFAANENYKMCAD